ncbi:Glutathione synthetase [Polyrhizophydium stewartii]|uniref:Glutathione synthetase n=1 Tax=Polyrhizophydium stewartii TaxID=2732419 RepID=A0ABR4MY59_9FUNG|nr:hypothetical protein HK105_000011 [Polyrhizophydium stewartii]
MAEALAADCAAWAMVHGMMIHPRGPDGTQQPVHVPFALLPSPFPLEAFRLADSVQPLVNALVDSVSRDPVFLAEACGSIADVDDFSRRLFGVHLEALAQDHKQPITLGIHRSDYLLHVSESNMPPSLLQVEINTISAGLPSLSSIVADMHQFALETSQLAHDHHAQHPGAVLPASASLAGVAAGIGSAWRLFGRPEAIVVMVVQPVEFNIFDQRWIEFTLYRDFGVRLVRKTLTQIHAEARLEGPEKRLFIGDAEVAVVYFRAGYTPRDYPTENEWTARTTLEISHAVKCPSIAYHLAGTKKVQQMLAMPGGLERFVSNPSDARLLRSTFTGLYPLDDSPEGEAAYKMALETPERFVLKPQREGGGNNTYGTKIREVLTAMTPRERMAFILMDLIVAPPFSAAVVRNGQVSECDVVSELGIFGVWLSSHDGVHMNTAAGHLLRTKSASVNEGGLATGVAVIDTPLLVPGLVYAA